MSFPEAEYRARVARAQAGMAARGLDALLVMTEPELRYFSGFLTRFWESPSRPWFLVLPQAGAPVAVIPSIGEALMSSTWIDDIRTWTAPDPVDDGVSLLAEALCETGARRIGLPMGPESVLRMPLSDFRRLELALAPAEIVPDDGICAALRAVKSAAEVAKIEAACAIAGRAFARMQEIAGPGVPLERVYRDFQRLCLQEGAEFVPYVAGGAGAPGYRDVISPAGPEPLEEGQVLMLDTGLLFQGYFCDFDRNYAIGAAGEEAKAAWARLLEATEAGRATLRPGATAAELFHAMAAVTGAGAGGRLGHGLGMQLTEGLSLIPSDHTVLEPGMVVTLEPGVEMSRGGIMVHEDDFVVTEAGARQLSPTAPVDLPVLA